MPKFIRKNLIGIKYVHITTHGISEEYIYEDVNEKRKIRRLILENQKEFNINVIAFCIMSNHLHLLIQFKEPKDLSMYMHKINTIYAIYYNKKHNRTGYVYKDRFHSQIIMDIKHLQNAIVYIHNNPVKAKICSKVNEYEFSSYSNFWKDKKKEATYIFYSQNYYNKIHNRNDSKIEYISNFEKISEEDARGILEEYLNSKHITIEDLKKDKKKLYEICSILRNDYKVSYRKLEKVIQIGREALRRVMAKI